MTTMTRGVVPWLLLLVSPGVPAPVAEQAGADPCSDERARRFDFWIGEWDVWAGE